MLFAMCFFITSYVFPVTNVLAGTTGKIAGQVADMDGNPLLSALVKMEHTQKEFQTQYKAKQGVYFILAVEPGIHTLIAPMIDYDSLRVEGVRVKW